MGNEDKSRLFILVELCAGVGERLVTDHDAKLISLFGCDRGFDSVEQAQLGDGDGVDGEPGSSKVSSGLLDDVRPVAVEFVVAVDNVSPFKDGELEGDVAFRMLLVREDSGSTPCAAPLASTPLS